MALNPTRCTNLLCVVAVSWLVLGYLLHSTGELCLSPVGLSMITRLSPKILVSTMMGAWFLATALSQYLAGIISQFTGAEHSGGEAGGIPIPKDTVSVYGNVFGLIAIAAMTSGFICLILAPMLKAWTHPEAPEDHAGGAGGPNFLRLHRMVVSPNRSGPSSLSGLIDKLWTRAPTYSAAQAWPASWYAVSSSVSSAIAEMN